MAFVSGTRIHTPAGPVAVEDLQRGQRVVTLSGEKVVRWIGRRVLFGRFVRPEQTAEQLPVRIVAGALGGGLPVRDLVVSPEQTLHFEGKLVPVRCLLNGTSIAQILPQPHYADPMEDKIHYLDVELFGHDVIRAEGLECAAYFCQADRQKFNNQVEFFRLYGADNAPVQPCRPVVTSGLALWAARGRIQGISKAAVRASKVKTAHRQMGVQAAALRGRRSRSSSHTP